MYTLTEYEKTALEAYGVDVIITRERSKDMTVYARGQVAVKNGKGYDIVVFESNHSNGVVKPGTAKGVSVYRSIYLPESEELGRKLAEAVVGVMKPVTCITYNRGVKTRQGNNGDYYGVIRGSVSGAKSVAQAAEGVVTHAYIVEHGFHDNAAECAFLNIDANLKKIAEAKAEAYADYFGLKKLAEPTETITVKEWQKAAIADGFKFAKYGADGVWGAECVSVARNAVVMLRATYKYKNLTKLVQRAVGATPDGLCGLKTDEAIRIYQHKHGLTPDGAVGLNTWRVILGV
jgi:peptidoglycan hydrolase-like protein with peptidoglycan-binding domain